MKRPDGQLIFVYNANSGKWNGYLDMMHKVFSPKTYPCKLCDITYGVFSINQDWKNFIKKLPADTLFLHKDEWENQFGRKDLLPSVFLKNYESISTLVDSDSFSAMDLTKLINALSVFAAET